MRAVNCEILLSYWKVHIFAPCAPGGGARAVREQIREIYEEVIAGGKETV